MKNITLSLYTYEELTDKAKKRAHRDFVDSGMAEDHFLPAHLGNMVKEKLEDRGIEYDTDSINALYSLGYSQGDGLMFEGRLIYKGLPVTVKHSGHYYHERSATYDWGDSDVTEAIEKAFEEEYIAICKEVRDIGYNEIEYNESEEQFAQACEANEWTFEEDGRMRNV